MTSRLALKPFTGLLFLVLAAGAVGVAVVSQEVVQDQEQRLLEQRAAEVAAVLTLSGGATQEALRSTATLVQLTGGDPAAFGGAARRVIGAGLFGAMAVVQADGPGYQIVSAQGEGLEPGPAKEAITATLERAGDDGRFVSTPVFTQGGERHLGFAAVIAGQSPRTLVYGESILRVPQLRPRSTTDAFGDLEGALFVGDRPDAGQAVIQSSDLPLTGRTVNREVRFGADHWLLVARAKDSLVGGLAQRQPWLFLVGGLVTALLVATLVEVLLRRREYAMALADTRTAELRRSLKDLDDAQQRLVRQERLAAIGQLASAVGHELRNPLGVVTNVLYLLGNRSGRDEAWVDRQLRTADREVAAATLIVSDLLEFARPREPIFGDVDVKALIQEVLWVAAPPENIEVVRQWPDDLAPVRADRDQLRQVLLNLFVNAYDAMPDGGRLTLSARGDPTLVEVTVGDTGVGMDEETRSRLFEAFYTTKTKGIGLGLSVSQRIVEAHGGAVRVESQPGAGSLFSVTLPAVSATAPVLR